MFRTTALTALVLLIAGMAHAGGPPGGPVKTCAVDAVVSGAGCMDKYEASVWRVPRPNTANRALVTKIRQGTATVASLKAGGATPLGALMDDYAPCADSGQNCTNDIYALSLPGVTPSAFITWFQAEQACANSGKRLPTSAEWQAAVAGTPDPGPDNGTTDCNTASTFAVAPTGSRKSCVSSRGAFDMVGNLFEWVADWVPRSTTGGSWDPDVSATGDLQGLIGADDSGTGGPGALLRGGDFIFGGNTYAGPLAISAVVEPSNSFNETGEIGFRCAR